MSEPQTQLLLLSPPLDAAAFSQAGFPGALERLLDGLEDPPAAGLSTLLLRDGPMDDAGLLELIAPIVERAQSKGLAVLLENRVGLVEPCGCDGVHVTLGDKGGTVKKLRQRLGGDLIIGAGCGASRHAAIEAGEQGADYIAFGSIDGPPDVGTLAAEPELIDWWAHWMTPPVVAFGVEDLATARSLAALGADFLALPPSLWSAAPDPLAAFAELSAALGGPD